MTDDRTEVDELELWEGRLSADDEYSSLIAQNDKLRGDLAVEKLRAEGLEFVAGRIKGSPESTKVALVKEFFDLKEREIYESSLVVPSYTEEPYALWAGSDPKPRTANTVAAMLDVACEDARFSEAMDIVADAVPENTTRARAGDIRYWGAWCNAMGVRGRPVTPQELLIFVVDHAEGFQSPESQELDRKLVDQGYKNATGPHKWSVICRRLATLSKYADCHSWTVNPTKDRGFKAALRQLSKKYASNDQPRAITRSILIHLIDHTTDDIIGKRDKALLTFLFGTGGRRRSEAEEALIEDLEDQGDCLLFHMRKSKTNKTGQSEPKPLMGVVAQSMRDWLNVLGEKEGPLFRPVGKAGVIKSEKLKGAFINRIVKKLAKRAGYDPKEFSAHSLRSGFVTQAAREGCSLPEVKALTGHKTDAMVSRYYQQGDVLRSKAGNLL